MIRMIPALFAAAMLTALVRAEIPAVKPAGLFARTYQVDPNAAKFCIRGITGSIFVSTHAAGEIKLQAEMSRPPAKITDTQLDNTIQVAVLNDDSGPVKFDIVVPEKCALEVKCLNGTVTIKDALGSVSVETTDGDILLRNIRASEVTARTTSGKINYDGDIGKQGNYVFQSFNNSIDLTVPASAAFQLAGTAYTGDVNLGGFTLQNFAQGSKRLTGSHGEGTAKIHLTTHRGQIRFHKR